ncbi:MAG: tyrosine-type recombinase/integrase, partial [Ignavibacteria bacterium]|nr:tyrosine-type recombinase/integrase [Ignavibacteria bacterium]
MATLRKRPKPEGGFSWYVDFYYKGKRYVRSTKTDNKKFAGQVLKEIEAKITRGEFNLDEPDQEKNVKLNDFIEEYLADARIEKTPGTVLIDQDALHEFRSFAGESIVLRDIPESMARSFRAYLVNRKNQRNDGKLSPTSVNMKMRCLRTAFNWAMAGDRRYVDTNVFAGINQLHVDTQVVRALTFEDVSKLFEHAEKDGERGKRFARYLKFLLMTGCRRMEALDLQWGEVDFHGGFVTFKKTKTDEGRVVPLNTELTQMLQEMYAESGLRRAEIRIFPFKGDY